MSGKARGAAELFDSKARHPTSESLDQQEIFARINAARIIARHIKRRAQAKAKIRNRRAMLRAHGVGPPAQLRLYNHELWGSNYLCLICEKPVSGTEFSCATCPAVLHFRCYYRSLDESKRELPVDPKMEETSCPQCIEEHVEGRLDYRTERVKLMKKDLERRAIERICRYVRGFKAKREYRITLKAVIVMQASTRKRLCRRDFTRWKRSSRRPYTLHLTSGSRISGISEGQEARAIVLLTDNGMQRQLHRFDSNMKGYYRSRGAHSATKDGNEAVRWNQTFLVPGTSQDIRLVVTIVRSDDVFLGQAHISMSTSHFLMHTTPQTTKLELPLGELAVDPKVLGTTAIYQKELRVLENIIPSGRVQLEFAVPSSLFTICDAITGPHIDVMRGAAGNPAESTHGRRGKWWGCLLEGCLNLYREHDQSIPSQQIQLRRVDVRDSPRSFGFIIVFPDKRRYEFEVETKANKKRWLYAVQHWVSSNRPSAFPSLNSLETDLLFEAISQISSRNRSSQGPRRFTPTSILNSLPDDNSELRLPAVRSWLTELYDPLF